MQVNLVGFQLKELFEKSRKGLVVLGDNADVDLGSLAASLLEVFLSYKKESFLVTSSEIPLAAKPLVKEGQLRRGIEPKSLVLSFDWTKSQLDKVSYKLEGNRFNLIISSTGKKIDPAEISYAYQGSDYDLIVTVGVQTVEFLEKLGLDRDSFERTPSINLDKSSANTNFAKINIVDEKVDSLCSLAVNVFKQAEISLPTRAAETLLFGIRTITDNFSTIADPSTFEAAAYCKRCMIPGMVGETRIKEAIEGQNEENETPEGWLSPKIFRSSRVS